jgi:hypothetical protein
VTEIDPVQDPARDLLAFLDLSRAPDGSTVRAPISLDQAATMFGAMIQGGRPAESRLERDYPGTDDRAMSGGRGKVIATLLEEIAIRLEPGRAVGPIQSSEAISELAESIASYLRIGY